MGRRIAVYARVSTRTQSTESQRMAVMDYIKARGFELYKVYEDFGVSGAKESRPSLNELMADARKRLFDAVLVFRFDRFARSTKHLVTALQEFKSLGIDFLSYSEGIDTSSPMGEFIFTIFGALAQMEREIIRERINSGLRRARANGKHLGRPPVECDIGLVYRLRGEGHSMQAIADFTGLSKSKVFSILNVSKPPSSRGLTKAE